MAWTHSIGWGEPEPNSVCQFASKARAVTCISPIPALANVSLMLHITPVAVLLDRDTLAVASMYPSSPSYQMSAVGEPGCSDTQAPLVNELTGATWKDCIFCKVSCLNTLGSGRTDSARKRPMSAALQHIPPTG